MKISNLQTNVESITIAGNGVDLPAGWSGDLGNLAAVIRGGTYVDDETNVVHVVIQPSNVVTTTEVQPLYEFSQGAALAGVIAPVIIIVLFVRKYFARGDAFD